MPIWIQIILAIGIDIGLSVLAQSMNQTTQSVLLLKLGFQLITSVWAAWDSSKIELKKYKVPLSFHPAIVFLLCMLLWLIVFPLYLFARNKALSGKAPLKDLASQGSVKTAYFAKLLGFALVSLAAGGIALFCMFAPRINPGFLNDHLFRSASEADDLTKSRIEIPEESKFFKQLAFSLQRPFTAEDFRKLDLEEPEDVHFRTSDGVTLKGWFFATPQSRETVLLSPDGFFGMRFPVLLGYIKTLQKAKFSVFVYDYRKFSQPGTKSNVENVLIDGRAAYDCMVKERKIDPAHLILMGRELGAYVCCQLSKDLPCAGMVLEDPWTNLKDHIDNSLAVAMRIVPLSLYPGDGLDNLKALKGKHPPILIAGSSLQDAGAYKVYESIDGPKSFVRLMRFDSVIFPDLPASSNRYVAKLENFLQAPATAAQASVESRIDDLEQRLSDHEIKWQTNLDQALLHAKAQNKLVLVDFYTDWCGPCKLMDARTYSNATVQNFMDAHLISVKINAEDPKLGQQAAMKYRIMAYPTVLILNPAGAVVDKMRGFVPAKNFLRELKAVFD
jgi:thiol-disulfide isomerase/thioredoxin